MMCHREGPNPEFRFRVVKTCKSALERQVKESVRIQLRGSVLNKKGTYNRCKLTRMVIDSEWENQVWKEAWEGRKDEQEQLPEENDIRESRKEKRTEVRGQRKKRRVEDEGGKVWGEQLSSEEQDRIAFLKSSRQDEIKKSSPKSKKDKTIGATQMLMTKFLIKREEVRILCALTKLEQSQENLKQEQK